MSIDSTKRAAGNHSIERRLIRVEIASDQAGITAALRRAFAAGPVSAYSNEDDHFADLLSRIH